MTNKQAREMLGLQAEEYCSIILGIAFSMYYDNAMAPRSVVEELLK